MADADDGTLDAIAALYDRAGEVELRDGEAASVDLYADVIRKLEGRPEPRSRTLLVYAMDNLADVHWRLGRDTESRSMAERLVEEHFDDPPPDAAEPVVHAALLVGTLLRKAGAYERALDIQARVIERYGQPGVPDHDRTRAEAGCHMAWTLRDKGDAEGALGRFEGAIVDLGDPAEPDRRAILAQALVGKAFALSDLNRATEATAMFKEVVDRFAGEDDPDIVKQVAQARDAVGWRWRKDRGRGRFLDLGSNR